MDWEAFTLDDSEHRGPCGHWANPYGKRVYDPARLALANELEKCFQGGVYTHPEAEKINQNERPCTPALFITDYRILLKKLDAELSSKIWSEMLCHPVAGRRPGANERLHGHVIAALSTIIAFAEGAEPLGSQEDVYSWLESRSTTAATRLGAPWPKAICRMANFRSVCSRATTRKAAGRLLDALSLIHAGQIPIRFDSRQPASLVEILIRWPMIRFDHVVRLPSAS
jgi:hypothetical protein